MPAATLRRDLSELEEQGCWCGRKGGEGAGSEQERDSGAAAGSPDDRDQAEDCAACAALVSACP